MRRRRSCVFASLKISDLYPKILGRVPYRMHLATNPAQMTGFHIPSIRRHKAWVTDGVRASMASIASTIRSSRHLRPAI